MNYILSLLGAWFGFANPIWHIPGLVLLFPLSLCLLGQQSLTWPQAIRKGWAAGWLAYAASLYWIALPVHNYAPLPWILAIPCPLLVSIYLGLYPALFTLAAYWAGKKYSWFLAGIFLGLIWTCLEYIRNYFLTGFSWNCLTQAFSPWPTFIQLIGIVGAFAFSGILVTLVSWLVFGWPQKKALCLSILVAVGIWGYGYLQIDLPMTTDANFSASIIQGNIEQGVKWDPDYQNSTLKTYLELSQKEAQQNDPNYLFWPETAMPFYLQNMSPFREKIRNFCNQHSVYVFTGAPGYAYYKENEYKLYNRAYLINPQGAIVDLYEKEHLVPFGEYVPLSNILPFLQKIVVGYSDFSTGTHIDPIRANNLALGTLICYEIIFPNLVNKRVNQGANILVNLSNDAWFGNSSAPKQHLHQAVLRAIENNRFIVRTTNTGISAFIDPHGRILKQTSLFQKTTRNLKSIPLIEKKTYFSRHYFPIVIFVCVSTAIFILASLLKKNVRSNSFILDNSKSILTKLNRL